MRAIAQVIEPLINARVATIGTQFVQPLGHLFGVFQHIRIVLRQKLGARIQRCRNIDTRRGAHTFPDRSRDQALSDFAAFSFGLNWAAWIKLGKRKRKARFEHLLTWLCIAHRPEKRTAMLRKPFKVKHLPALSRELMQDRSLA